MNTMNWSVETGEKGKLPIIVSEYLLNDTGVFAKREKRMPKNEPFTAITGFRVGYIKVKNADHRMALMDRNAILWHKITLVSLDDYGDIVVTGNRKDVIIIRTTEENRLEVTNFIDRKRMEHPPVEAPDKVAAAWMCWRDDDEWEDPSMPLVKMVENELRMNRFIEDEILEETMISVLEVRHVANQKVQEMKEKVYESPSLDNKELDVQENISNCRPMFCCSCGSKLPEDGLFCENCGNRFM